MTATTGSTRSISFGELRKNNFMEGKDEVTKWCEFHDYNFRQYKGEQRTDKIARNLVDYEAGIIDEVGGLPVPEVGDAQAISDFTWELLFLSPWELAYISIPMAVLGFYGLSLYAIFKYIQKKFS